MKRLDDCRRQDDPECQPGRELEGGTALVSETCHTVSIGSSPVFLRALAHIVKKIRGSTDHSTSKAAGGLR